MLLTRRAFLAGTVAVAAAGCRGRHPAATRPDPDAATLAAAAEAERGLLTAYDAVLAVASADQARRLQALRADHAAHLAALGARPAAGPAAGPAPAGSAPPAVSTSPTPSTSPPPPTRSELVAEERSSASALRGDALAATRGRDAALLASIAASHLGHAASQRPLPLRPDGNGVATTPARVPAATVAALQAALSAEHEIVYGYGLAGARLTGPARRLALAALTAHSTRRDTLVAVLVAAGARPVPAAPAYRPPFPVTNRASALRLAIRLEDAAAGAAWDVVATTARDSDERAIGVDWLGDAAERGAQWRTLAHGAPPPALPGHPG